MEYPDILRQIARLDTIINNPARLMIVYLLSRNPKLDYIQLMNLTHLSSGNITTHLQKLLQAGYITQKKAFIKQKPNTSFKLTERGSAAYALWGETVLAALPDNLQHRKQIQLIYTPIPWNNTQNRLWDSDPQCRYSFIRYDKGLQLLPPISGTQL